MSKVKEFEVKDLHINFYENDDATKNLIVAFDEILVAEQSPTVNGLDIVKGPVKALYIAEIDDGDTPKIIT